MILVNRIVAHSTGDGSVCDAVLHNAVFLGSRLSNRLDTQNRPLCHSIKLTFFVKEIVS